MHVSARLLPCSAKSTDLGGQLCYRKKIRGRRLCQSLQVDISKPRFQTARLGFRPIRSGGLARNGKRYLITHAKTNFRSLARLNRHQFITAADLPACALRAPDIARPPAWPGDVRLRRRLPARPRQPGPGGGARPAAWWGGWPWTWPWVDVTAIPAPPQWATWLGRDVGQPPEGQLRPGRRRGVAELIGTTSVVWLSPQSTAAGGSEVTAVTGSMSVSSLSSSNTARAGTLVSKPTSSPRRTRMNCNNWTPLIVTSVPSTAAKQALRQSSLRARFPVHWRRASGTMVQDELVAGGGDLALPRAHPRFPRRPSRSRKNLLRPLRRRQRRRRPGGQHVAGLLANPLRRGSERELHHQGGVGGERVPVGREAGAREAFQLGRGDDREPGAFALRANGWAWCSVEGAVAAARRRPGRRTMGRTGAPGQRSRLRGLGLGPQLPQPPPFRGEGDRFPI